MGASSSAQNSACGGQEEGFGRRDGVCRLCFESDGDIIAPCSCKGSSKWIHRNCLDTWRASGQNPRAMTHCCECGFQYLLTVRRVENSPVETERRNLIRQMASQTILAFIAVQLIIIGLGMIVRVLDPHENLVPFFNLPQDQDVGPPGFDETLRHHKSTYYLAGLIVFLFFLGVLVVAGSMANPRGVRSRETCIVAECPLYMAAGFTSSGPGTSSAAASTAAATSGAGGTVAAGVTPGGVAAAAPGVAAGSGAAAHAGTSAATQGGCICCRAFGMCLVQSVITVFIVLVVVGFFAAIMALVVAVQQCSKRFAQLQTMRELAQEYAVQDLADSEESAAKVADAARDDATQQPVQSQLSQEVADVMGDMHPPLLDNVGAGSASYGTA